MKKKFHSMPMSPLVYSFICQWTVGLLQLLTTMNNATMKMNYELCSVAQSCLTLCESMDCNPPGSCVYGIFQVRILDWVAIFFSRGSSAPRDPAWASCIAGVSFTIWATREVYEHGWASNLFQSLLSVLLGIYLGVELLSHTVTV